MDSIFDIYKVAPKSDYDFADKLVKLSSGATHIDNLSHWKIIEELVKLFIKRFPQEAKDFQKAIPIIRQTRANKKGLSPTGELKYIAALPPRLMQMIKACFPYQQFDKKFIYNLIKRIPLMRVGGN